MGIVKKKTIIVSFEFFTFFKNKRMKYWEICNENHMSFGDIRQTVFFFFFNVALKMMW